MKKTNLTLLLNPAVAITLVILRMLYTGGWSYFFLIWNLFLAWLPLGFAWLAQRPTQHPRTQILWGLLWLLFLPNAPYLVTDLIHLHSTSVPRWYDALMLFSFAQNGLLLTLASLSLVQTAVSRHLNKQLSWLFAILALALSGIGVTMGRFLRWNSWDIFTSPISLLQDTWQHLFSPRTIVMATIFSIILILNHAINPLGTDQS